MKWPSLNNENLLTWKCKLFGCKDELIPTIFDEHREKHGITGSKLFTAATTWTQITFSGCIWCMNFRRIYEERGIVFPVWLCDCDICEASKRKDI